MKTFITKLINLITVVAFTTLTSFTCYAKELIPPEEYGPGFFSEYPDLSHEEIVLSSDKTHVLEIQDDAAIRIGLMEAPLVEYEQVQSVEVIHAEGTQAMIMDPIDPCEQPAIPCNRWGIVLSDQDRLILAQIVWLESGNQADIGQQAVVEVVFNRVVDPAFPNTVLGVLSQKGQFTTYKSRNRAPLDPRVLMNIAIVENGGSCILPFSTVYFSRGAQNRRIQCRIGGHTFCNK